MEVTSPSFIRRNKIAVIVLVVVCICAGVVVIYKWAFQQWQLTEFQSRLHEISLSLRVYKEDHGHNPNSLAELEDGQLNTNYLLAGATYSFIAHAPTNADELLLSGSYHGHTFEIRSETGVIFK